MPKLFTMPIITKASTMVSTMTPKQPPAIPNIHCLQVACGCLAEPICRKIPKEGIPEKLEAGNESVGFQGQSRHLRPAASNYGREWMGLFQNAKDTSRPGGFANRHVDSGAREGLGQDSKPQRGSGHVFWEQFWDVAGKEGEQKNV